MKFAPSARALLWPIILPVVIFFPLQLTLLSGGVVSAHGPIAGLLLLGIAWASVALIWEIVALPLFVLRLRSELAFRTRFNVGCALAAATYIGIALVFVASIYWNPRQ
jgi:hypothetical protein